MRRATRRVRGASEWNRRDTIRTRGGGVVRSHSVGGLLNGLDSLFERGGPLIRRLRTFALRELRGRERSRRTDRIAIVLAGDFGTSALDLYAAHTN